MGTTCDVCGDIGYRHLLLFCKDCKGSATHRYCLKQVLLDASLEDWSCDECQQRHGEVNCIESTAHRVITKQSELVRDAAPRRGRKSQLYIEIFSYPKETHSLKKNFTGKKSTARPMSNRANRKGHGATNADALHSCETIGTATATNNGEKQQVIVNCLGYKLGDIDLSKARRNRKSKKAGANSSFKHTDHENMSMPPKENNCMPSEHTQTENQDEYQNEPSLLLDREEHVPASSAIEEEISDAVPNFDKDNSSKRRRLVGDDNEEEDVQPENVDPQSVDYNVPMQEHRIDAEYNAEEAVQTGDLNNQNLNHGRPVKKRRRYIGANNDEEEKPGVGAENADFTLNDGANWALETVAANDHPVRSGTICNSESADQQHYVHSQPVGEPVWSGVFKINSEVSVKMDAHLSNEACQKVQEFSRLLDPVVEVTKLPRLRVWPKSWKSSGPTDDCIGLFLFQHSLRPNEVSTGLITEIIESDSALKVTVGIANLLIFPSVLLPERYHLYQGKHYLWGIFKRRKQKSDKGVVAGEQDGSACAMGERELQDQNLLDQQDNPVCAAEEGELQEQYLLDQQNCSSPAAEETELQEQHGLKNQQDEAQLESSGQEEETSTVNHLKDLPLVELDRDAQTEQPATEIAMGEDITCPGNISSHANPNSPKAGSSCSMHPEEVNQQKEDSISSPQPNATAVAAGLGQPGPGLEPPPTTKLFGVVMARTPREQQLIQELASEVGALVFPVQQETVAADHSTGGGDTSAGAAGRAGLTNTDADQRRHLRERPLQLLDLLSSAGPGPGGVEPPDHPQPDAVASDVHLELELFPVRHEQVALRENPDLPSV